MSIRLTHVTGDHDVDSRTTEQNAGLTVTRWYRREVEQPIAASGYKVWEHPDRHGYPILVERETPAGCWPQSVTLGPNDVYEVAL